MGEEPIGATKQHDRGVEQMPIVDQIEPQQQVVAIAGSRIGHTSTPDCLVDGASDLMLIKILNPDSKRGLGLPPLEAMRSLEQEPLIALTRHDPGGRTDSMVRASIVGVQTGIAGHAKDDHLLAIIQRHGFEVR
jgi:hypothetical protein